MSAYACNPRRGSEQAIGWNWAKQAARFHEVWVLTRADNQLAIEHELAKDPAPNLHFMYHTLPQWINSWQGGQGKRGERVYYLLWQLTALAIARRLHRDVPLDIGHHITYGGVRYPTFLAWLGIPFVLGPIGGAEEAPVAFYRSFGVMGAAWELARTLTGLLVTANPFVRASFQRANRILATTQQTRGALPLWAQEKTSVTPAIGIRASERDSRPLAARDEALAVLYVGRLVPWKGVRFAVASFATFRQRCPKARLTIVGDGPDRKYLQRLATRLAVRDAVHFLGELPYSTVMQVYDSHDVFLFPCFHLGGMAVLEAMNAGLVVVSLDLGDTSETVTSATGIKVPASNPDQLIEDLAAALSCLAADPQLRQRMSEEARRRIREVYDWDHKGDLTRELYEAVVGREPG